MSTLTEERRAAIAKVVEEYGHFGGVTWFASIIESLDRELVQARHDLWDRENLVECPDCQGMGTGEKVGEDCKRCQGYFQVPLRLAREVKLERERDQARHALAKFAGGKLVELQTAEAERDAERARLRKLAERYRHCRHACIDCFCTVEARAVLTEEHDG